MGEVIPAFEARVSRFRLEDFDTIQPSREPSRVKGLWPAVGVCIVAGPSTSGKSFFVLDCVARVCRSEPVLGRRSKSAGVLYVAAEGAEGVRTRISGLRSKTGPLHGAFSFIGQQPNLLDERDIGDLRATVVDAMVEMEARGVRLGIVVIDTLSASAPGVDENTSKDMGPVLAALQSIATELRLLVVVVAHTGKDESRGIRGWSGQFANADGVIMIEDPKGAPIRTGTVAKVKDGRSGDQFAFSLNVVEVGLDEDGDAITTCIVTEEEPPAPSQVGRPPNKAAASGQMIATAFNRLHLDKSVRISAPGANGEKGVRLPQLRSEAYLIGLGPSEPDMAEYGTDEERSKARRKWQDQRKADFDRGLDFLCRGGRMRKEDGWVWEPKRGGSHKTDERGQN